ncbi:hypothetical protein PBY51_009683 [Eleginops maclovinus]|uniref:Uncharacterized protein n=1 Tax=Eleginops maclovinus TaxID=56733 RepID=A0AAN8AN10_ELEMC|nr:hypothetical protein PBY51_009683 [Eleginops maclovinus]
MILTKLRISPSPCFPPHSFAFPSLSLQSLPTPVSLSPRISVYTVLLNPTDVAGVTCICLSVRHAAVPRH